MKTQKENLRVVYGNDFRTLAQQLVEELFFSGERAFTKRLVVVPDGAVKDFLLYFFANHPDLHVAAGVQILPLSLAVVEILQQESPLPSFLELSLSIEAMLMGPFFDEPDLHRYFKGEKAAKKVAALSDELAKIFIQYGLYAEELLPVWLEKPFWQQRLWKSLFSPGSHWKTPAEFFKLHFPTSFEGKIVLFGFSYLDPAHLRFFSSLNASCYLFSPCSLFWEDMVSNKERLYLGRLYKKRGVKQAICDELQGYMKQSHPLLANLGNLGKQMLNNLSRFECVEEEAYLENPSPSSLSRLQQEILTLNQKPWLETDDSIQIHSASSKLREVEILKDALLSLVQKDPIALADIVIKAPDISLYAPYIEMVFSQSAFPFTVLGNQRLTPSVEGFFSLLNLFKTNYARSSVMELLYCRPLMQKWNFSLDEVEALSRWFSDAKISSALASWDEGLDRLLFGLAVIPNEEMLLETWPIPSIPPSEIEVFGRFLTLFSSMRQEGAKLLQTRSVPEWTELFLEWGNTYFLDAANEEPFFSELKNLGLSCHFLQTSLCSFESIERALTSLSQKFKTSSSGASIDTLVFSSLGTVSLVAPRVIWCLGLDEQAFPRAEELSSLCQIPCSLKQSDKDRFAFLEMLMKPSDYLIFSYERIDSRDGKEQHYSLLIEELQEYIKGPKVIHHPSFPLDACYFSSASSVKRWESHEYEEAKAYYSAPQIAPPLFSKEGVVKEEPISIRALKKLARNPLQFYFNETWKIFLQDEENEEEGEFLLSALRKSLLRNHPKFDVALKRAKAKGELPQGIFQTAALAELAEEREELLKSCMHLGVDVKEIHSVPFKQGWITGELEGVTSKGLFFHGDFSLPSLIKIWPLYLIYLHLYPEQPCLLPSKEGVKISLPVENPQQALENYCNYFFHAKAVPSFFFPQIAKPFLEGNAVALRAALEKENEDPYFSYVQRRKAIPQAEELLAQWTEMLQPLFKGGLDAL